MESPYVTDYHVGYECQITSWARTVDRRKTQVLLDPIAEVWNCLLNYLILYPAQMVDVGVKNELDVAVEPALLGRHQIVLKDAHEVATLQRVEGSVLVCTNTEVGTLDVRHPREVMHDITCIVVAAVITDNHSRTQGLSVDD